MKASLFISIAIVFTFQINSYSQKDYKPGYIIKNNGDSLSGLIAYRNRTRNGNSCFYKKDKNAESILLSPLDIKTFGYLDGERFDSKMLPVINGQVFVNTHVKGRMSLYSYYETFYIETDKLIQLNDKKVKNEETNEYVKILNALLVDCSLSANNTKYKQKDITNLIQNYNRCKGGAGIKYEKQREPATKLIYYVFYGQDNSHLKVDGFNSSTYRPSYSSIIGGGLNITVDPSIPKLFVNIEASYLKKNYHGYVEKNITTNIVQRDDYFIEASFIRIPLGFGYNFSKELQTPYVKAGVVQYYKLEASGSQLSERESYGTVTTSFSEYSFRQKNQRGYWIAAGFNKNILKYKLFIEFRYEATNGFIGKPQLSESITKNLSVLVGVRF